MKKLAPKHPHTLYWQAQLAFRQKDFVAARDSIQQLLAVAPGYSNGLLLAGAIDFELKSYTQAKRTSSRFSARRPASRSPGGCSWIRTCAPDSRAKRCRR
jgi:predicted Zn-dependent protease